MIGLKEQKIASQIAPEKPLPTARRRRKFYPSVFSMGPVSLCITSVLLIGLMAVFYLSQVNQAVSANQQLQDITKQQVTLERQNQDLVATIADEQSPQYIADNAHKLGLVLADQKTIQVLIVKHLLPFLDNNQGYQP
ncbi:MAG: septum formation initiator family protein [Ktedonobacteraceae bacterium]|nr:septum formation initiator family protein [Ktedonobacteraceae bacterium]